MPENRFLKKDVPVKAAFRVPEKIKVDLGEAEKALGERIRQVKNAEVEAAGINFPPLQAIAVEGKARNTGVGEILDTVGIELEGIALSQVDVKRIIASLPRELYDTFKIHRDASTEMKVYPIIIQKGNKIRPANVNFHTREAQGIFHGVKGVNTIGYELISNPMDIDTAELAICAVLPQLASNGDFLSERCATHVHVGMGKNLSWIKNCLKLGLWADDLFYSLAGMGKRFRGHSNNAIYARPLKSGPFFEYDGDYYQVINWQKALESRNLTEFFYCYGLSLMGEHHKYTPSRYFSINLYSILLHGTVEFRVFNQCFNPRYVNPVIKLCQLFTEIAIKSKPNTLKNLEPCDVFSLESNSYYVDKLETVISLGKFLDCQYGLSLRDVSSLKEIISTYKGIGIKDIPVMTHLNNPNIYGPAVREGGLVKSRTRPLLPGNIDIHNIQYISIME